MAEVTPDFAIDPIIAQLGSSMDPDKVALFRALQIVSTLGNQLVSDLNGQSTSLSELSAELPINNIFWAHKFAGSDIGEKINNAVLAASGNTEGGIVVVQSGLYTVNTLIQLVDVQNVTLCGFGRSTILRMAAGLEGTLINLAGSSDVTVQNLVIDGSQVVFAVNRTAIGSDGTATNPSHGRIRITGCVIKDFPNKGIALGATAGNTLDNVEISHNLLLNVGDNATEAQNAIDVSGAGTKRSVLIAHNRIVMTTTAAPIDGKGNVVFCGHGDNRDFVIANNVIIGSLGDGIQLFDRPSGTETTLLKNFTVQGNTIFGPRANGLSVYGGKGVTLQGNSVLNPGSTGGPQERRAGVLLAHKQSGAGPTDSPQEDLLVIGNSLIDDGGGFMMHAVLDLHSAGNAGEGGILLNRMAGGSESVRVSIEPDDRGRWFIIDFDQNRMGFGKSPVDLTGALARLQPKGDAQCYHSTSDLYLGLSIESNRSQGNFRYGIPFNARFNPAVPQWDTGFDGVNNGAGWIFHHHSLDEFTFHLLASAGGASQAISPNDLDNNNCNLKLNAAGLDLKIGNFKQGGVVIAGIVTREHSISVATEIAIPLDTVVPPGAIFIDYINMAVADQAVTWATGFDYQAPVGGTAGRKTIVWWWKVSLSECRIINFPMQNVNT